MKVSSSSILLAMSIFSPIVYLFPFYFIGSFEFNDDDYITIFQTDMNIVFASFAAFVIVALPTMDYALDMYSSFFFH